MILFRCCSSCGGATGASLPRPSRTGALESPQLRPRSGALLSKPRTPRPGERAYGPARDWCGALALALVSEFPEKSAPKVQPRAPPTFQTQLPLADSLQDMGLGGRERTPRRHPAPHQSIPFLYVHQPLQDSSQVRVIGLHRPDWGHSRVRLLRGKDRASGQGGRLRGELDFAGPLLLRRQPPHARRGPARWPVSHPGRLRTRGPPAPSAVLQPHSISRGRTPLSSHTAAGRADQAAAFQLGKGGSQRDCTSRTSSAGAAGASAVPRSRRNPSEAKSPHRSLGSLPPSPSRRRLQGST